MKAVDALGAAPPPRFVADMKAGVTELRRRLPGKRVAATGFCFGGGMTWLLLASKEARLAATVPFYGPFPPRAGTSPDREPPCSASARSSTRGSREPHGARTALRRARLKHQIVTFPGVDHAFFNPTGSRYDVAAATEAYRRMVAWLGRYVAS